MRILVAGASDQAVCGVRDHARTLAAALEALGADVAITWWERRPEEPWRHAAAAARTWAGQATEAAEEMDAVLWHYSPFAYGFRGAPILAPRVAAALGRPGRAVVPLLHELALQWRDRGWRGAAQAATQRVALAAVLRRCSGAIVTTATRAAWLESRAWLPRRPVAVIPVFSNVPVTATATANGADKGLRVGVFGFRMRYDDVDAVTSAFAVLRRRQPDARLVLVGAPGPDSEQADRWRLAATRADCAGGLEFSGVLAPAELSSALAGLDTVVYADPAGPTSRRGTLAAALAHGCPVVAIDGPQRWEPLRSEGAVVLSSGTEALACDLERLAEDPELRRRLGERGRAFYDRLLAPPVAAASVLSFLETVA